ncbi:hypothetical protein M432DRAFT_597940 [Thermoascus aurantiacus ATCC 26904]
MALRNLLPLLILLILVAILAFIGFVVWGIVQGVGAATRERMEKRHVLLSREGVTVGVRELTGEDYIDRSQSVLVSIWNHSSFPTYKHRLFGRRHSHSRKESHGGAEKRKSLSK